MHLLDTDTTIDDLNRRPVVVTQRLEALPSGEARLSAITLAELVFGAMNSDFPERNLRSLVAVIETFQPVPFDAAAAERYGELRAYLRRLGQPIGDHDMLIAATALAHDATLVTNNEREFRRVPGLRLETGCADSLARELALEKAHHQYVHVAAVLEHGLSPAALQPEAYLLVDVPRPLVRGVYVQLDAVQVHHFEPEAADRAHGVGAVAAVPLRLVADGDAELPALRSSGLAARRSTPPRSAPSASVTTAKLAPA